MPRFPPRVWRNHQTFSTRNDLDNFLKAHNVSLLNDREGVSSTRMIYQCCSVKRFKCKYQVEVVCPHISTEFCVAESGEHVHVETGKMKSRKLVTDCAKQRMTTDNIRKCLQSLNLPVPEARELYNWINHDRRKDTTIHMTVGDLTNWCQTHGPEQAQTPETPFVPAYEVTDDGNVFVFVTTKKLLSLAPQSDLLQVDATYKLTWNRYTVKVIGSSDKNRRFHPFGIAITTTESTDSYVKLFRALVDSVAMVSNTAYSPAFLMADGAAAITSAAEQVFPGAKRLMCYFHAFKNMRDNRNMLPEGAWIEVEKDISDLHNCPEERIFRTAADLALQKWEAKGWNEYARYFREQWVVTLPNWFQGAAPSHPSTNNGLESLNKEIKRKYTLRKALPLGEFLNECERMLSDWTAESISKGFKNKPESKPELYVHDMTVGYQFSRDPSRKVVSKPECAATPGSYLYFIPSLECCCTVEAFLAPIFQGPNLFQEFGDFQRWLKSYYIVENARGWFFCTCPVGLRDNICKHTVGVQIMYHGLDVPAVARAIPLGQVRGPGRPRKVGRALQME